MARNKGSASFSGTLEPLAGGPLDARAIVPAKSDLTTASNFPYPYVGMIVSVTGEGKAYMLTATPVTTEANWKEIGSGSLELGETSTTAYRGDRGKTAYDFSQAPYTSTPAMDGTGSAGSSTKWAKGDHVHPKDTTKADKVSGATNGHLAALNSSGNLTDSGKALSDLQAKLTAGDGISIDASTNTISADVNYLIGAYDIYDSTERVVGYYYGKPLYRKTIDVPVSYISATTEGTTETKNYAHSINNISQILSCKGVLTYANAGGIDIDPMYVYIPATPGSTYVAQMITMYADKTNIVFNTSFAVSSWANKLYVVLEYTKTTDSTSSVSYGHENQYSTSEQIVGTWIDGKPLYQKTVSVGPLPNASIKNIAHGISNFRNMVSATAYAYNPSAGYSLPMPYNATYSLSTVPEPICYFYVDSSKIYVTAVDYDLSSYTEAYVTLQYIKTT